jgi:acyl-CoA synthetase (AMP-forming)/AMP-acid ligase II
MTRRTLIDFFDDLSATPGNFLVYDDGYRTWSYSYADVASSARALAARFAAAGITKGETVAIWSENRPEGSVAVWGCLPEGFVLVPTDYRPPSPFLPAVLGLVTARQWRGVGRAPA